ncbi:hypothetical protein [Flavihumibacter fluvii]|uniref:hypothetical protein n=1 Tax=Flavihumibacter fluvii TaxID=2838157 RepID=UPI001BDF4AD1|nr:hypothetical protein [Flavihumibacter fluvii]ULQ54085.1 hypothetical protein KJS93_07100 [Flavihumibacter fluvii]
MKKTSRNGWASSSGGIFLVIFLLISCANLAVGQSINSDSSWKKARKNIIRYDLTGGLLFGMSNYIVFGYERAVNPHQSFSINTGKVGLPKVFDFVPDSFYMEQSSKNSGFNISGDYRFYLKKENKYNAPRGVYIGPYYSFNQFKRNNDWTFKKGDPEEQMANTTLGLSIHTFGAEVGYQFILWDKLAIDLLMFGPGLSNYYIKAKAEGNLSEENKEKLQEALTQYINDKFPGMNYVLDEDGLKAKGVVNTWSFGYRFIIHVGFNF